MPEDEDEDDRVPGNMPGYLLRPGPEATEILILSPHGPKAKTALADHSNIGEWPLVSFGHVVVERRVSVLRCDILQGRFCS